MAGVQSRPGDQQRLLAEIQAEMRMTSRETGRRCLSPRVEGAFVSIPRHQFVPEVAQSAAYDNRPLSIGEGQTISQPFIVALMTELLDVAQDAVVLEVGTGSGYQAAVLSRLAARVVSVEVRPTLAASARKRLKDQGCDNVAVIQADGYLGWPDEAPYDAIMVTAAAPYLPPALVDQLRPNGRMVIPIGEPRGRQTLRLVIKHADGPPRIRDLLGVAFVPLVPGS